MKKIDYKSAMSKLKTSEDFEHRTLERLSKESRNIIETDKKRGDDYMKTANPSVKKNKVFIWATSVAACAVLTLSIYAVNQNGSTAPNPATNNPNNGAVVENNGPGAGSSAKQRVNIDGVIEEVSADGQSFRIGELWVTVTEDTTYGISDTTAPDASEQLVSKEFKVGNTVSGFTSEDVASGKVTANVIYNNF
ncbi:hypothetical protein [Paenibacillus sp. YIM B09110]|uniref:hypothetical protein n=1 Tax=Paenibacillus sp. YIM B09110 TaxID=3126102 RepID=UPI00301BAD60